MGIQVISIIIGIKGNVLYDILYFYNTCTVQHNIRVLIINPKQITVST